MNFREIAVRKEMEIVTGSSGQGVGDLDKGCGMERERSESI